MSEYNTNIKSLSTENEVNSLKDFIEEIYTLLKPYQGTGEHIQRLMILINHRLQIRRKEGDIMPKISDVLRELADKLDSDYKNNLVDVSCELLKILNNIARFDLITRKTV